MIVAGFGFRVAAEVASLLDAYDQARGELTATHISTAADKCAHPAINALAETLNLPLLPANDLPGQSTLTRSAASEAARGTGSLAEAAALAALDGEGCLLGPRTISSDRRATCALARKTLK